jgi:hypothetical protein
MKHIGGEVDGLGSKLKTFGKATALAVGGLAVGGVVALGKAFTDGLSAAQDYQDLAAKSAAVIKSTGNEAHVSVKGIQNMAASLESLGTTDEELIINSQNVLLTFTNIRNVGKDRIFDQATKSALDMSVALGTDLQGASIQVGKALNDPIKGVTALSKVGVSFTQAQRDQIKALVDSGKTMDAQKIILGELSKEFGGAAQAAGKGFRGSVFRAKDALGDLERDIVTKALPGLTKISDWVTNTGVPKLRTFSDWMGDKGVPLLVKGFKTAKDKAEDAFGDIDISGIQKSLTTGASKWGGAIISGVQVGLNTGDWSGLGATLGDGLSRALTGAGDLTKTFVDILSGIDWFEIGKQVGLAALPFALAFVSNFGSNIFTVFKEHPMDFLLAIVSFIGIGKIGGPLAKILDKIPILKWFSPLLRKITGVAKPFSDAVGKVIGFIGSSFREGFERVFPDLAGPLTRGVRSIADGIALRAMYMKDAALKFVGGLISGIGERVGNVVKAGNNVIERLSRPFRTAAKWLVNAGQNAVQGLIGGVWDRLNATGSASRRVIDRLTSPFSRAGKWLYQRGRELLAGLRDGMYNGVRAAGSWARGVGGRIVSAVKSFFGIRSPSRVFGAIGTNLITSLFNSMMNTNPVSMVNKIFGSMPKALGALVDKGMVKISALPSKAMNALSGLGGKFAGLLGFGGSGGGGNLGGGLSAAERWIIMHESGGRTTAQNPTSTAFGLGQLLIANRQHYGAILGVSPNTTDYGAQLSMFRMYVRERYGNAENAQAFWQAHHWYGSGGMVNSPRLIGAGERGPERVLSAAQTASFEKLVRVLDTRSVSSVAGGSGSADIDYARLGDHVARAIVRSGLTVKMDGRAVGKVLGGQADLTRRTT